MSPSPKAMPSTPLIVPLEASHLFGGLIWVHQGCLAHSCQRGGEKKRLMKATHPDLQPHWYQRKYREKSFQMLCPEVNSPPTSASWRLCKQKFPLPCCCHCYCFGEQEDGPLPPRLIGEDLGLEKKAELQWNHKMLRDKTEATSDCNACSLFLPSEATADTAIGHLHLAGPSYCLIVRHWSSCPACQVPKPVCPQTYPHMKYWPWNEMPKS